MKSANTQLFLQHLNINKLNDMQQASLDAFKKHDNIILLSNTGSGKTIAFLLPLVLSLKKNKCTQALIVVPSRELAQQIESVFKSMKTTYKITACYGGHKREIEENNLIDIPEVIVGTPGRIGDHIRRKNIDGSTITMLFLDEYDKILEFGFVNELKFIYESLKEVKKQMLISATDLINLPEFINHKNVEKLNFLTDGNTENKISYKYLKTKENKTESLFELLCSIGAKQTIIFCNHRDSVERVNHFLKEKGIASVFYHGALQQNERDTALAKFRNKSIPFLVTSDLASRGLDIDNIRYIIHYHLPSTSEIFTHRNGRTARMDKSGSVILLLSPQEYLPDFIKDNISEVVLSNNIQLPPKSDWITVYIPLGKKNKINKVDIVGFFIQQGGLKKEDIGLIEVKDFHSFIALRRNKVKHTFYQLKDSKIKNKKAKLAFAK